MTKVKAIGRRGDWFARVQGDDDDLPCVHQFWIKGLRYDDPHVVRGDPVWERLIDAIQTKRRVILTNDWPLTPDGRGFARTGYIAVFEVEEVEVDGTHLRFALKRRIKDLQ